MGFDSDTVMKLLPWVLHYHKEPIFVVLHYHKEHSKLSSVLGNKTVLYPNLKIFMQWFSTLIYDEIESFP